MDRNIAARRIQRAFRHWLYSNCEPDYDNIRRDYYERQAYEAFMHYY
jgi:hypothetical protein